MLAGRPAQWATAATVVLAASLAVANDSNPPTAHTGAPAVASVAAERLCSRCHGGNALNSGGQVELLGAPATYTAGQTYSLRVRVTSPQTASSSNRVWSFELTAVRAGDGGAGGTLADVAAQGTAVRAGTGTSTGGSYQAVATNDHGGSSSPVEWQVNWAAPVAASGDVVFYFTGLAGDGTGGTGGDWVYTGFTTSRGGTTAVRRASWGGMKALFR
jgi:hypothetical protein